MNVILKKMNSLTKQHYFRSRRCIFLMLALFILPRNFHNSTRLGLDLFFNMTFLVFAIILILAPASCYWSAQKERKNNSLDFLILANFNAFKIILLQYLPNVFNFFIYVLSTLPVFIYCFALGGISAEQILYVYLALFCVILYSCSVGIFLAVSHNKGSTIFSVIFYSICYLIFTFNTRITSFRIMIDSLSGLQIDYFGWTLLFEISIISWILYRSSKKLQNYRDKQKNENLDKQEKHIKKQNDDIFGKKNRKKEDINIEKSIEWKDYYFIHKPIMKYKWGTLEYTACIFCVVFGIFTGPFHLVALVLIILFATIKSFSNEKEGFQLLLMSPLSNKQIIKQKIQAIKRMLIPHLRILFLPIIIYFIMAPRYIYMLILILAIFHFLIHAGLLCSFLIKTQIIATIATIILLFVWCYFMQALINIHYFDALFYNKVLQILLLISSSEFFIGFLIRKFLIANTRKEKFINRFL